MGLAKTAESVKSIIFNEPTEESQRKLELTDNEMTYANVPVDYFHYFDIPMGGGADDKTLERLREIHAWAREKGTKGEQMSSLRELERKLGVPHATEKRYNRVWNWVRISNSIKDLELQRDSLSGSVYI